MCFLICAEAVLIQVLTSPPDDPGLITVDPIPTVHSHTYEEFPTESLSAFPIFPASQASSLGPPPSLACRHSFPGAVSPTLQRPSRTERTSRHAQRLARSYDPVRGRRNGRLREGGRGRTRGTPNYKPREVQVLLDLVEEELPIASKGWKIVGCQFRDWAVISEFPTRTDRSLELKFKQVHSILIRDM